MKEINQDSLTLLPGNMVLNLPHWLFILNHYDKTLHFLKP